MATRVGHYKICLTSFDSLTLKRRKDLGDNSYISQVIADFFSNFIAMATGVIRGEI